MLAVATGRTLSLIASMVYCEEIADPVEGVGAGRNLFGYLYSLEYFAALRTIKWPRQLYSEKLAMASLWNMHIIKKTVDGRGITYPNLDSRAWRPCGNISYSHYVSTHHPTLFEHQRNVYLRDNRWVLREKGSGGEKVIVQPSFDSPTTIHQSERSENETENPVPRQFPRSIQKGSIDFCFASPPRLNMTHDIVKSEQCASVSILILSCRFHASSCQLASRMKLGFHF